mmetsp:Transcript_6087/g.21528  ORF Transcript_6087/g.21528 Transcript_6087/m.21528 type:complete len:215 (+) Transcript_6087:474-1118(+)
MIEHSRRRSGQHEAVWPPHLRLHRLAVDPLGENLERRSVGDDTGASALNSVVEVLQEELVVEEVVPRHVRLQLSNVARKETNVLLCRLQDKRVGIQPALAGEFGRSRIVRRRSRLVVPLPHGGKVPSLLEDGILDSVVDGVKVVGYYDVCIVCLLHLELDRLLAKLGSESFEELNESEMICSVKLLLRLQDELRQVVDSQLPFHVARVHVRLSW